MASARLLTDPAVISAAATTSVVMVIKNFRKIASRWFAVEQTRMTRLNHDVRATAYGARSHESASCLDDTIGQEP
jgi:hypothetical protein